ncbi:GtrA family protein [Sphingomonas bacterium]|uniref:GtrA family protein n=1 Tax=Sphingomonas bacterium TaxID=1895847 RepID=UPI0020C7310D|nr:GtrA family protein [Sphingomonas bacterium]
MTATAAKRRELFWQLVRYGVNGCIVTGTYTAVFVLIDSMTHASPQICNAFGYLVAVMLGYFLHSRVTFKGHGERGRAAQIRFFAASFPSVVLNAGWTWLLISRLQLPHWTVQVPIWCITPILLFALNRWWVFREA